MRHEIDIINPLHHPRWDSLLEQNPQASFFHTAAWARVLAESYRYEPLYFTQFDQTGLSAVVPVMEVRSVLTGRRGVSLPFSDYCQAILPSGPRAREVMNAILAYGKRARWKYFELRSGRSFVVDVHPSTCFYRHVLDLTPGSDALLKKMKENTRRNIRKAQKQGVEVARHTSHEALQAFYRLNCLTRKRHGLPPQPLSFFNKFYEHVIAANKGFIVLATHEGETIAAAVFVHFNGQAVYKYGASDLRFQQLRANNLVMWEAISWYAGQGYSQFCFGRSEPENKGLLQFKNSWGAEEEILEYYRYDLARETFVRQASSAASRFNGIFSRMPVPVLNAVGNVLYKHMG